MQRARDIEIDRFPIGSRVRTPSGRTGTVIKHRGSESRLDCFVRVTVQFDGGRRHDLVTLQPHLLTECCTGPDAPQRIKKP